MINVFTERSTFIPSQDTEPTIHKILNSIRPFRSDDEKTYSIVDQNTFLANWNLLTSGILNGLNWQNVFIAGGSVLGCLLHGFTAVGSTNETHIGANGFHNTDIDIL
jgi:hypothetical protein